MTRSRIAVRLCGVILCISVLFPWCLGQFYQVSILGRTQPWCHYHLISPQKVTPRPFWALVSTFLISKDSLYSPAGNTFYHFTPNWYWIHLAMISQIGFILLCVKVFLDYIIVLYLHFSLSHLYFLFPLDVYWFQTVNVMPCEITLATSHCLHSLMCSKYLGFINFFPLTPTHSYISEPLKFLSVILSPSIPSVIPSNPPGA